MVASEGVKKLMYLPNLPIPSVMFTLLGVLYDSGLRKSEVLSLEFADFDFDRGCIHVRCGKGRKDRYVPFSLNMQKVMRKHLSQYHPSRYVFEKAIGVQMPYTWPTKVLDND